MSQKNTYDFDEVAKYQKKIKEEIEKGNLNLDLIPLPKDSNPAVRNYLKKWLFQIKHFSLKDIFPGPHEEIIFHSGDVVQVIYQNQTIQAGSDLTNEILELAIQYLCLKNSVDWNLKNPFVSFKVSIDQTEYRTSLIHSRAGIEPYGKYFFRKIAAHPFSLGDFGPNATELGQSYADYKTIVIAGSTGSGKTTLATSLIQQTSQEDHIILIEDTEELIAPHQNTTRLLAHKYNGYGLNDYMTYAMRMSPKRIVLGEMRAKEIEAYLLALNCGHKGLVTTVHANSAEDAIARMTILYQFHCQAKIEYPVIHKMIASHIDEVVFMENKSITEHIRVLGSNGESLFYKNIIEEKTNRRTAQDH